MIGDLAKEVFKDGEKDREAERFMEGIKCMPDTMKGHAC